MFVIKEKDKIELLKYGYEYEKILNCYFKVIVPNLFNFWYKIPKIVKVGEDNKIRTIQMFEFGEWTETKTEEKDIKKLLKRKLIKKVEGE